MDWTGMLTSVDPVIWMRIARTVFYLAAGLLMLREPMLCGGKNTPLHRLLSLIFFVNAWYSFTIARLRMMQFSAGTPVPIVDLNMLSEIIMTGACIALVAKLGYDYVRWQQYHKLECTKRVCDENTCVAKIENEGPRGIERRQSNAR